jgi:ribosome recycling factor
MIADVKKTAEQKMQKSVETLKSNLGKVRTGRAHTGLLDHIKVDYYGNPTPINQVASVSLIDPARSVSRPSRRRWRAQSRRPSAIPVSD